MDSSNFDASVIGIDDLGGAKDKNEEEIEVRPPDEQEVVVELGDKILESKPKIRSSTLQFMSERVDGDDTVHESNVLDFLPGTEDSFVMRERRESRKTSVCKLLSTHKDFEFNIAVMGQDREGNQNFIRNLLTVR